MKTITCRSAISAAVASVLACAANAQTEAPQALEEITVIGIRESILQSQELKRRADQVVDAVTAEDIGKFTDENLAEAIQRVPGVQIDREGGEGRFVSIRGLGPQFNRVTINGRTAISIGDAGRSRTRAFNFDTISSDIVSRLEVFKTPTADMDEGGLGGVVNIRTARPLEVNRRGQDSPRSVFALSAQGQYSDNPDTVDPKLTLFASHNVDDRFGVIAAVAWNERSVRQDVVEQVQHQQVDVGGNTGVLRVRNYRQRVGEQDRERLTASLAGQWRVTEAFELNADMLFTEFDTRSRNNMFQFNLAPPNIGETNHVLNADGTVVEAFDASLVGADFIPQNTSDLTDTFVGGINATWDLESWQISADVSYGDVSFEQGLGQAIYSPGRAAFAYDARGGTPSATTALNIVDPDPSSLTMVRLQQNLSLTDSEEAAMQLDLTRALNLGMLDELKFGVKYRDRQSDTKFNVYVFNTAQVAAAAATTGTSAVPVTTGFQGGYGTHFATAIDEWLTIDPAATFQQFAPIIEFLVPGGVRESTVTNPDPTRSFGADEQITSGYVQAGFSGELLSIPFQGNLGLRYAATDTDAMGFAFNPDTASFEPAVKSTSYSDALPSANIKFDLTEDVVLRLGAAKVIARPDLVDLTPTVIVLNVGAGVARSGNPDLDPFRATQFDAYVEWYPGSAGEYLALGYFHKDIDSFTTFGISREAIPGFTSGEPDGLFDVSRPMTAGNEATVKGIELAGHLPFDAFIPGLEGFGVRANYTYVDAASNDVDPITGHSLSIEGVAENNYNIVAYYEHSGFGARLSYTFRDEFLRLRNAPASGGAEFTDAYDQLDVNLSYRFNDSFSIVAQAINLTDEVSFAHLSVPDAFRFAIDSGRRYIFGVRAEF